MHITLFAPELLWPEPGNHPPTTSPALERLLARSQRRRAPTQPMEDALCALFGYPERPAQAALRRRGEAEAAAGAATPAKDRWLCADPVHLRFDDDRLLLAGSSQLGIDADEAAQLVATLNAELAELGEFVAADAERWYLRLAETAPATPFEAPPPSAVAGRHIGTLLPDLLGERDWRRHFSAIQTILHAHPINQQRQADGRMTINGLWLWGDTAASATNDDGVGHDLWSALWSEHPLALGLARAGRIGINATAAGVAPLLAAAPQRSRSLVVLPELLTPTHYDDIDTWQNALAELEQRWFAPLEAALKAGRVTRLEIVSTTVYGTLCWTACRRDLWCFWKKGQPLSAIAARLAKED